MANGTIPPLRTVTQSAVPVVVASSLSSGIEGVQALGTGPMARLPSPTIEDIAPPRRRRPWIAVAVVAVVAAAAAVIALYPRGERAAPEAAPPPAAAVEPPPAAPVTAAVPPPVVVAPSALDLRIVPAGAKVRIDGAEVKVAHGHLVQALAAGTHTLSIEARGHEPYERTFEIPTGGTLQVEVELDRVRQRAPARRTESRRGAEPVNRDGTIDPFE
jgi:hypothetical protein